MTWSLKFLQKVLSVRAQKGPNFQAVVDRFGGGIASIVRWEKDIQPKKYQHSKPRKTDLKTLAADVKDHPDDYQKERARRFGVKQLSICYALRCLGITHKENLNAPHSG